VTSSLLQKLDGGGLVCLCATGLSLTPRSLDIERDSEGKPHNS